MRKKKFDKKIVVIICMNICLLGLLLMTFIIPTPIREHVNVTGKNSAIGLTKGDHLIFSIDTNQQDIIGLDIVGYQIKSPIIYGDVVCELRPEGSAKTEVYRVPIVNMSIREEELSIEFNKRIKGKFKVELYLDNCSSSDEIGICIDNEAEQKFKFNDNECDGMISYGFIIESSNHPYIIYVLFIEVFFNMLVASYRRKEEI